MKISLFYFFRSSPFRSYEPPFSVTFCNESDSGHGASCMVSGLAGDSSSCLISSFGNFPAFGNFPVGQSILANNQKLLLAQSSCWFLRLWILPGHWIFFNVLHHFIITLQIRSLRRADRRSSSPWVNGCECCILWWTHSFPKKHHSIRAFLSFSNGPEKWGTQFCSSFLVDDKSYCGRKLSSKLYSASFPLSLGRNQICCCQLKQPQSSRWCAELTDQ